YLRQLVLKDLSEMRSDKLCLVNSVSLASDGKVVHRGFVAFPGVVDQTEVNSNGVFAMQLHMRKHRFIGVHVHAIHEPPRLIGAYGQQTDLRGAKSVVDALEMVGVCGVSRKIDSPLRGIDEKGSPQRPVGIPDASARSMDRLEKKDLCVLHRD